MNTGHGGCVMNWLLRLTGGLAAVLAGVAAVGAQGVALPPADPPPGQDLASLPAELLPGAKAGDCPTPSESADKQKTPPPFGGPLFERPKLTGDWCGCREA